MHESADHADARCSTSPRALLACRVHKQKLARACESDVVGYCGKLVWRYLANLLQRNCVLTSHGDRTEDEDIWGSVRNWQSLGNAHACRPSSWPLLGASGFEFRFEARLERPSGNLRRLSCKPPMWMRCNERAFVHAYKTSATNGVRLIKYTLRDVFLLLMWWALSKITSLPLLSLLMLAPCGACP